LISLKICSKTYKFNKRKLTVRAVSKISLLNFNGKSLGEGRMLKGSGILRGVERY
jgi:hypothetical protein